ncbi:MAG: restriction endonuclease subunit S [Hormoscilla sp. GM7CHS1pb]|nr:restriction endonuclease subunit S [Hormoscilla sp. GM7CHS1pb]
MSKYQLAIDNSQVPEGYKQTKVGLISEDWEVRAVGEICDFIVPGRNKPKNFKGDIPWITTPDIEDGRSVSESKLGLFVSRDEAKNVGSKVVPAGAVIMSCVGELGIVAFVERSIVINQQLHAFIPTEIIDPFFLLNALQSQKDYMLSIATLTAVPYLNKDNCNSIPIPIPPLPEQRAIAQTLSDVDGLIAALDQAIAKKRNIKTATMQELLTGKKRLPGFGGEWETKRLGDIANFYKGVGLSKAELMPEGTNRCIHYGELFTIYGEKISQVISGTSSKRRFVYSQENDVLMPTSDVTPNGLATASCITKSDVILGSDILVIRTSKNIIDGEFLAYSVKKNRNQIMQLVSGTTVFHLYGRDMANFVFNVPEVKEQGAIASILSDMDAEIAALEKRRAKTQAMKQGMMQELLTGKTRLIVPNNP